MVILCVAWELGPRVLFKGVSQSAGGFSQLLVECLVSLGG